MTNDLTDKKEGWLGTEGERSDEFTQSNDEVNNPTAPKTKLKRKCPKAHLNRSRKILYIRSDYQRKFDELVVKMKYAEGKNAPILIEEAIELLLRKYQKSK